MEERELYEIGNSFVKAEYIEKITNEILEILKKEKQTYAVDKFVLENAIKKLSDLIVC